MNCKRSLLNRGAFGPHCGASATKLCIYPVISGVPGVDSAPERPPPVALARRHTGLTKSKS